MYNPNGQTPINTKLISLHNIYYRILGLMMIEKLF